MCASLSALSGEVALHVKRKAGVKEHIVQSYFKIGRQTL